MPKKDIEKSQPEVNIGLVGHVDHGKTTLTKCLTGIWTDIHSEELKRGITIRLGYADAIFYYCEKDKTYFTAKKCIKCMGSAKPIRKVSFVDAPGHETLMATMLSGAAIMDGAILIIAANEKCPQPQTQEHLMALNIMGIKNIVIVQNKIDLVDEEQSIKNYKEIKEFIKGTVAEKAPIIPISAQHSIGISEVIQAIEKTIKTPKRDSKKAPLMFIARSFDVNKPGTEIEKLIGGILGGSLKQGVLKIGDEIEISPGLKTEYKGKTIWKPVRTRITGLKTGGNLVKQIAPGGSIGLLTPLDPSITKSDQLTGSLVGKPGKLPSIWYEFTLKTELLKRVVGAKEQLEVENIKKLEPLMLNVNAAVTVGIVTEIGKNKVKVKLKIPVCCDKKDKLTISRRIGSRWHLIGFGFIQ